MGSSSTPPPSPAAGTMYYHPLTQEVRVFNGSTWVTIEDTPREPPVNQRKYPFLVLGPYIHDEAAHQYGGPRHESEIWLHDQDLTEDDYQVRLTRTVDGPRLYVYFANETVAAMFKIAWGGEALLCDD